MTEVGMENDGTGHTHVWGRDEGACVCGAPVPAYLKLAWETYANRVDLPSALDGEQP